MTAAAELVAWAHGLTLDDVPVDVRDAASRHLLDGLGTALAADRLGYRDLAAAATAALGSGDEATVLGSGTRATAAGAALANGLLVHALDFDDTHADALVHATAVVLPAALAAGEASGASGAEVLTAAVAGYEIVARLGAAVRHGFHRRGFHATSVCGVFAAAVVAGRLLGLDEATAVHAVGIAGSQAAGSLEFLNTGDATKQLHPGLASQAGVVAVRLAAAGANGPATILEGDKGLFAAYADARVSAADLTVGLGERWETTRITIKPYPVCQLSHASLDAVRVAAAEVTDPEGIVSVAFEVPRESAAIVCEPAEAKRAPRSVYEARFSLPWCAATAILEHNVTLDHLVADRVDDAVTARLAQRVSWTVTDPDVAAAEAPGAVTITLADGRDLHAEVATSRGGPGAPLPDASLIAKFTANVGAGVPADALAPAMLGLAAQDDLRTVMGLSTTEETS